MKNRIEKILKVCTEKDKELFTFILKMYDKMDSKQKAQADKAVIYHEKKYQNLLDKKEKQD